MASNTSSHVINITAKFNSEKVSKDLAKQMENLEKNAKVEVDTKVKDKSKELLTVIQNLERINKFTHDKKWSKNDIFSALTESTKRLNEEMSKTNKNNNVIHSYEQQILVFTNALKNADKTLKDTDLFSLNFKDLFKGMDSNTSSSTIKFLDSIKDRLDSFGDINSISLGSTIDRKYAQEQLKNLESLADEMGKMLNIKIRSSIKIEDILGDKLLEEREIPIGIKGVIENPQSFGKDAEKALKDSGVKIGVGITPTIENPNEFHEKLQKELKDKIGTIEIDTKPIIQDAQANNKNTNRRIAYHYGNISDGDKNSSHPFLSEISAWFSGIKNGGRGWADGTGAYTTSNIKEYDKMDKLDQFKKFYAIDTSKLNMYEAHTEESAEAFYNFIHTLEQYCITMGTRFQGFENIVGELEIDDLYKTMQNVFPKTEMTFEKFQDFVDNMIDLLGEVNVDEQGNINAKEVFNFKKKYGIDDIKTRFLKQLGYQGTDLSGTSYDSLRDGSVIFSGINLKDYVIDSAKNIEELKIPIIVEPNTTNFVEDVKKDVEKESEQNPVKVKAELDVDEKKSEVDNIEQKSEELKDSLAKDFVESKKYVEDIKRGFVDIINTREEMLKNPKDKDIPLYQKDIDNILKKYPELEKFKESFNSMDDAIDFTKTNEWLEFLETLPKAQAYLDKVGHSFNEVQSSGEQAATSVDKFDKEITDVVAKPDLSLPDNPNNQNQPHGEMEVEVKPIVPNPEEFGKSIRDQVGTIDIPIKISSDEITSIADVITSEKDLVNNAVISEKKSFNELASLIREKVIPVINEKTKAFEEEASRVLENVGKEIQSLEILLNTISNIAKEINELPPIVDNDDVTRLDSFKNSIETLGGINLDNLNFSTLEAFLQLAKDDSIKNVDTFVKGINRLVTNTKNLKDGINDDTAKTLKTISTIMKEMQRFDFTKMNFSSLTSFLNTISGKSKEEIGVFVQNLKRLRESIDKLNSVKLPKFTSSENFNNFVNAIKSFPTEKQAQKFAIGSQYIKQGFDALSQLKELNFTDSTSGILSAVSQLLANSEDLKNLANILKSPAKVVKEAKDNQQVDIQRNIGEATSKLNDATKTYTSEMKENGINAVTQTTKDYYQSVLNIIDGIRNTSGIAKDQIKQLDNAIQSSKDSIAKVEDSILEKQRKAEEDSKKAREDELKNIDSKIASGAFGKQIESFHNKLDKFVDKTGKASGEVEELTKQFNIMSNPVSTGDERLKALEKYTASVKTLNGIIDKHNQEMRSNPAYAEEQKGLKELQSEMQNYGSLMERFEDSDFNKKHPEVLKQIKSDYIDVNDAIKNGIDLTEEQVKKLKEENKVLSSTMRYQSSSSDVLDKNFKVSNYNNYDDAYNDVKSYITKTLSSNYEKIIGDISSSTKVSEDGVQTITAKVREYGGAVKDVTFQWNTLSGVTTGYARDAGVELTGVTSILDKLRKKTGEIMAYWAGNFLNPFRLIGFVKQGIGIVQQYDDALVELRKVSDETEDSLKRFVNTSFDIGDSVGATALQIQKSTAEFLRLGENLKDATKLAKQATVLFNVSEFTNIEDATKAFISMSQAFEDVDEGALVDKLNIIGNNFAISTEGLATALKDSAAALRVAGNDLDESIALATAGNRIAQNPEQVGKAIRTIALRLTGTKEAKQELKEIDAEFENINMTTSKLRDTIKNATKVESNNFMGIDILDANGNYKSTYEILLSIADIYQEIVDTDKRGGTNNLNLLLETIAGKNRASIAGSIIQSADELKNAYEMSTKDFSGSAQEELNKYLDSITAKITEFQNQVQRFWVGLIDSDVIKFFVELGTKVLKAANTFGQFKSVLVAISAMLVSKKFGLKVFNTAFDDDGIKRVTLFGKRLSDIGDSYKDAAKGANIFSKAFHGVWNGILGKGQDKYILPNDEIQKYIKIRNQAQVLLSTSGNGITDVDGAINAAALEVDKNLTITEETMNRFKNATDGTLVSVSQLKGSFKQASGAIHSFGNIAKSVFSTIGSVLINSLITFGITKVISIIIDGIDNLIHSEERLSEKVRDIYNRYDELDTEYKKHKKTVDDISKRFEELSKGVDAAGNNVSLTTEEFDEYHTIVNQIKDMFPKMIKGYDDQGRAILGVKNNVVELNKELENEKILANDVLIQKREDIQEDWQNKTINATSGLSLYGASVTETLDLIDRMYTIVNNSLEGVEIPEDGHIYIKSRELTNLIADFAEKHNTTVDTVVDSLMLQSGIALDNLSTNRYMVDDFRDKFDSDIDIQRAYTETKRSEYNSVISQYQELYRAIYENAMLKLSDSSVLKDNTLAQEILGSVFNNIDENIMVSNWINDIEPSEYVKDFINAFATAFSNGDTESLTNAYTQLIEGVFVKKTGEINDKYGATEAYGKMSGIKTLIIDSLTSGISDEATKQMIISSVDSLFDIYGYAVVTKAAEASKTTKEKITELFNLGDINGDQQTKYNEETWGKLDAVFDEYNINTEKEFTDFFGEMNKIVSDPENVDIGLDEALDIWREQVAEKLEGAKQSLKEFLSDDTNKSQIESYEKDMSRIGEAIENFNNLDDSEKMGILNEFADKFPEITEDGELTIDMLYKLADAEWEQVDALFDGVKGAEKYRAWLKKLRDEARMTGNTLNSKFAALVKKDNKQDETQINTRIKGFSNARKQLALDWYDESLGTEHNADRALFDLNNQLANIHFDSLEEMLNDDRFKQLREEYENLVDVFANGKIDTDELQSLMEIYNLSAEDVKENAPKIYEELKRIMEAFTSGAGETGKDWWDEYCKGIKRGYTSNKSVFYDLSKSYTNFIKNGVDTLADGIFENNYSDVTPDSLKLSEILEDERFNLAIETRDKINEAYKDGLSESEVTEFMTMFDMSSQDVRDNLPYILEFCNKVVDIFGEAGGEAAKEYIRRYTEEQENGEKDILTRYYELGNTTFTKDDGKNVTNKYTSTYYSRTASNAEKEAIIKYVDDIGGTFNEAYEHLGDVVKGGFDSLDKLFEDKIFSDALEEYEEISEMLIDGIDSTESESLLKKYGYVPTVDELEETRQSALNIIDIWSAAAGKVGLAWNEAQKKIWGEKYKQSNQRTLLLGQLENLNVQDDVKSYLKGLTDSELSLMLKAGIDENATVNQLKEQLNLVKNELDANGILDVQIKVGGNDTTVGSYYDETISKAKTLATVVNSLRREEGTEGKKYWSDIVGDEATFNQLLKIMPDLSEYMSQYSGDAEQTAAAIAYLEENGQRLYDEFVQNTTGLTELDGATDGARAAFEDMLIVLKQITGLDFKGELKDIGDSLDKIYFDGAGDQARSFADAISDVESEIDTLKSAYNDLMSVDIKQDSQEFTNLVNTLIQQFPELIDHTDSIEELRNAVAQLLNEKSDNLILRLIELRDTEGIPDELRGKINALIDSFTMLGNQPFSMDNTMNVLKSVRGELNQLAKFINEVNTTGLHLDMTASDEVYNLYPELLENAKIYSDGTIELDRAVYENFIKTREAELKGDIDARVKELENQNTVLKSKIQYHEQRLNLAKKALATENLYDMEAAIEKIETADTLLEAEQANDAERVKSYNEASRIVAEDKKDLVNYQIEADNTELEHEQDTDIAEVESDDAKTINKMENDQTYAQHNTEMLMGMSENYAQEMTDEVEMSAEASEMKQENEFAVANAAAGVGNDIVRMSGDASEKSQSNALTASEKIQNAAIWIGQKAALAAENWRKIGTNEGATNMGSAIMSGISGAFKTIGGWVQRAATTVSSAAKGELIQATKGEIKSFKDQFQGTFLNSIGDTISALKHSIDVAQVKQAKQDALKNIVAGNIDGVFEKALSISELKNDPSKINEFADSIKGRLESARETLQSGIESDEAIIADLYEQLAKNEYNIELLKANGGIDLQEMAKKLAADNAGKSGGSGSDHTPSGGSGGSGSDRDAADNANEFSEIIDWIEVKIKRLEEEIARLDKIAGNSFENYFDRAKAIEGNLDNVRKEIEVTRAAYYRYMMEANNIPLDENYRRLVREGAIAIEDIHDEELSNAIKAYTEWYDKAVEQQQKLYDLVQQVSDLYQSAFDLIQSRADSVLSSFQNASNLINSAISRIQERGYLVSEKYYEKLVDNAQTQIYILEKKHEEMLNMFQEAVDTGAIEEGSQAWYDYKNQVDQVTIAIDEMTNSIIQYNNAIRQLQWDKFDLTQGMVGELSSESDFLINLMSKYDMYSKEGFITNRGMSTKGLHGLNYNVYMQQADEYRREMLAVSRDLANDPNNQTLYNRRKELLELQREMILAAEQEKEALKSLVSDGIQKTLSYLQELISKYGEALDQQKSLYDYQKNIANQTKNITNLQKQLLSLGNDDSEETRKRVQELNNNLNTAQENLQETLYERAISDQKELLNGLYDDFNEILNTRLDNLDVLIAEQIGEINLASGQISDTINTVAGNVGYQITTGVGAVFESSNFNSLPALATYTTELMNELSNDRALITEELTKGQTSTLTNINENAAMIEGYLTGVAAALGYDGKTAASLIGDSVYGINLNAEKIDHISSLLGTGEGNIAENIHNAFSEDLSLLNSVFSGEDSLPNLIGAMVSTLEGAIGDSENNIFTKAFDNNTTIIQNEIQEVKDKVDKMDRFSDVIAAIDLGTGKVGDVITSMGSVNTTLTQIKEMMEKLFNVKATTPDSSKVTASSGSAAANGTGNYTKANVVAATGNGGSGKTGASTAVNAAKSGTKQGNGKPEVGDRVTFTGSYYFSAWQVRPVGNYLAGQPNAVEIDRDVSGYSGVSKPYHIKKAGTKPGEPWSDMGWVSLDQLKGYYLGTKSVDKDRFAIVNERGAETIVRPDGSILTPLSKKSMVVDAKATDNMWRMLKDPEKFMSSIFKDTNVISNNNGGNISNDINITIPINSVSDFADFMRQVQNSNEWERMFDAMLNNRLKGTSKFAKYNVNF